MVRYRNDEEWQAGVGEMNKPATSETVKQAEALVHLMRDLSVEVEEVEAALLVAPLTVRMAVHSLLSQVQGRC